MLLYLPGTRAELHLMMGSYSSHATYAQSLSEDFGDAPPQYLYDLVTPIQIVWDQNRSLYSMAQWGETGGRGVRSSSYNFTPTTVDNVLTAMRAEVLNMRNDYYNDWIRDHPVLAAQGDQFNQPRLVSVVVRIIVDPYRWAGGGNIVEVSDRDLGTLSGLPLLVPITYNQECASVVVWAILQAARGRGLQYSVDITKRWTEVGGQTFAPGQLVTVEQLCGALRALGVEPTVTDWHGALLAGEWPPNPEDFDAELGPDRHAWIVLHKGHYMWVTAALDFMDARRICKFCYATFSRVYHYKKHMNGGGCIMRVGRHFEGALREQAAAHKRGGGQKKTKAQRARELHFPTDVARDARAAAPPEHHFTLGVFDLETFPRSDDYHTPYALGYRFALPGWDIAQRFYGPDCVLQYLEVLRLHVRTASMRLLGKDVTCEVLSEEESEAWRNYARSNAWKIYSHNGARFDMAFMMRYILETIETRHVRTIFHKNQYYLVTLWELVHFQDFLKIRNRSLDSLGKELAKIRAVAGQPFTCMKGDFPHKYMSCHEDLWRVFVGEADVRANLKPEFFKVMVGKRLVQMGEPEYVALMTRDGGEWRYDVEARLREYLDADVNLLYELILEQERTKRALDASRAACLGRPLVSAGSFMEHLSTGAMAHKTFLGDYCPPESFYCFQPAAAAWLKPAYLGGRVEVFMNCWESAAYAAAHAAEPESAEISRLLRQLRPATYTQDQLFYQDCVSMYPSRMKLPLPGGKPRWLFCDEEHAAAVKYRYKWIAAEQDVTVSADECAAVASALNAGVHLDWVGVVHFDMEPLDTDASLPLLPIKMLQKLFFGHISAVGYKCYSEEVLFACRHRLIRVTRVRGACRQQPITMYKGLMEEIEASKAAAEAAGLETQRQFCKDQGNSCYGKTGQTITNRTYFCSGGYELSRFIQNYVWERTRSVMSAPNPAEAVRGDRDGVTIHHSAVAFYGDAHGRRIPVYQVQVENEKQCMKDSSISVAIAVTSLSRIHLAENMLVITRAGGSLVYADTDSIVYVAPRDLLAEAGMIDSVTFGKFKNEYKRPLAAWCALGPKCYTVVFDNGEQEVKCKGVPLKLNVDVYSYDKMRGAALTGSVLLTECGLQFQRAATSVRQVQNNKKQRASHFREGELYAEGTKREFVSVVETRPWSDATVHKLKQLETDRLARAMADMGLVDEAEADEAAAEELAFLSRIWEQEQ